MSTPVSVPAHHPRAHGYAAHLRPPRRPIWIYITANGERKLSHSSPQNYHTFSVMAWEETDLGVYRAVFGGSEKIYHKVATLFAHLKREHYRVHCVCSLEFSSEFEERDPATALKEAWKTLRTELPTLGVLADGPGHKVYKILDVQGERDWLDRSFFLEPHGKSSDEVIAREPLDFPSLHFMPSSSEVIFLCSHWRIDAIGTNWVLDRLFSLLVAPRATLHSVPSLDVVSPGLEGAIGSLETWTEEQETYARSYIQSFRADSFPNDRMPYKGDAATLPGNPARQTVVFDPTSTAHVIAACKVLEISVTAAVHSALAQTVFALADGDDGDQPGEKHDYTCATSMNLRPKLPAPYNTRAHAVQTYVIGCACRVRRDSSFADAARALTKHYKVAYGDERVLQSLRPIYKFNSDATPVQQKKGSAAATPSAVVSPPPLPSGITISSIGIVDNYLTGVYGGGDGMPAVRVREYHFGIDMMTRQMIMYVGTFRGKLQLSISYNAGYYDPDVPRDVLKRVGNELEKGLGVELAIWENLSLDAGLDSMDYSELRILLLYVLKAQVLIPEILPEGSVGTTKHALFESADVS
ncbi:hypothetical protein VC83_09527 [Pseudogymnoascus destructans]|uniref:Phthiocerol/phthiodiolone dimycocerosyl transferase C-terminal domain-containing protein n=1 Tax=Pseudogymnoascus destructans TaxID=655981 RepID=A0A176ZYZ6_9PEZI|nr:uncharacterized protein VC83_09527 [Pseudogymnoascus destructans]OAF54251.2 hypothetical protein VC83_09527 [Pseudogymnoascus destructans]